MRKLRLKDLCSESASKISKFAQSFHWKLFGKSPPKHTRRVSGRCCSGNFWISNFKAPSKAPTILIDVRLKSHLLFKRFCGEAREGDQRGLFASNRYLDSRFFAFLSLQNSKSGSKSFLTYNFVIFLGVLELVLEGFVKLFDFFRIRSPTTKSISNLL